MDRIESLLVRTEIEALIADFAFRIDHGHSETVAELFTEDGWYGRGGGRGSRGRDAIREAYAKRAERGARTARHLFTNLHLSKIGEDHAEGTCILLLFAADGEPPLPATPLLIQDYQDIYKRVDGKWLFASRDTLPLFVGDDFAPVLPLGDS